MLLHILLKIVRVPRGTIGNMIFEICLGHKLSLLCSHLEMIVNDGSQFVLPRKGGFKLVSSIFVRLCLASVPQLGAIFRKCVVRWFATSVPNFYDGSTDPLTALTKHLPFQHNSHLR